MCLLWIDFIEQNHHLELLLTMVSSIRQCENCFIGWTFMDISKSYNIVAFLDL